MTTISQDRFNHLMFPAFKQGIGKIVAKEILAINKDYVYMIVASYKEYKNKDYSQSYALTYVDVFDLIDTMLYGEEVI